MRNEKKEPCGDNGLKGEGDRFLLERIRHGDSDAFCQLVDRFGGRLTAYAGRRLSGTGIDPEDAVQEAFLGFLQSVDRLQHVRTLQAYLFQILRNKMVDLVRRRPEAHGFQRVQLASRNSDTDTHGYEPVASTGTPSSYLRRNEAIHVRDRVLADILDEAINVLREEKNFRDLKVLELLFYRSWKNRQIAAEVGISEPTVTRVKASALETLSRLAANHPLMREPMNLSEAEDDSTELIATTWSENLLSCLKRSTLGAYALEALDSDWADYVAFHLDTVGCEFCAANLEDLKGGAEAIPPQARERIFASSVGFLRKLKKEN
jgi:RNA polymerase sigma-70 factor (ECF subfamily)